MSNEHKLSQEMSSVLDDIGKILNGDRPATHGDIADFAATHTELHGAYISGMMRARRSPTQLDTYAFMILQKLARIANSAPEHAEPHFIDIAGYAVAGTAHARAAAASQAEAQAAEGPESPSATASMANPEVKTLLIGEGKMVPPETDVGTQVFVKRRSVKDPVFLGTWQGPDMGLQGGPAPKR